MFTVEYNEQTKCVRVLTVDEQQPVLVAEGKFDWDQPDRTFLAVFHSLTISADQPTQLSAFLSAVLSDMGKTYRSLVVLRLPAVFDQHIDFDQLQFQNNVRTWMGVRMKDVRTNSTPVLEDSYELITDKQRALPYAEPLVQLMNKTAFWADKWNLPEMQDRIQSASAFLMILDKTDDIPCGFGRLFLLKMPDGEILGYLSDIAVRESHQSKGFGRIIVNYLIDACGPGDQTSNRPHGTLWLKHADQGSGAVSAPKLYRRSGFQLFNELGNRIAAFATNEFYQSNYDN